MPVTGPCGWQEAVLSCPGPVSHTQGTAQGQDKRGSGPEHLHPLRPEAVTDPVLLVHPVSVHWEQSRAFHRGPLIPEREGRQARVWGCWRPRR